MKQVDYKSARQNHPFTWQVVDTPFLYYELTGIGFQDYYSNPSAGIELFKKGRPIARELFGPDLQHCSITTPPTLYGHINAIGADLIFSDVGAAGVTTICDSLEDAVSLLSNKNDFEKAGKVPFYLNYLNELKAAFTTESISFGYRYQGPITTAYNLRHEQLFYDIYDDPERLKEMISLIVDSIVHFQSFLGKLSKQSHSMPRVHLADDISSMISPQLWPEFVLPFLEKYYNALGSIEHTRSAHIENLKPDHLRFLEEIGLTLWDPSISPALNPEIIFKNCRVPFGWLLGGIHYPDLTKDDVRDFVFKSAADGASFIFTVLTEGMAASETVEKVITYIEAAKEVEIMLKNGVARKDIVNHVSLAGRKKFWREWSGFRDGNKD